MIALWCLLDHVRQRYCLESAVLIDNFGHELVAAGQDWHAIVAPVGEQEELVVQKMQSAALPGRKLPGLLVIRGPESVIRSAFEDLEQGMHRIFYGEEPVDQDRLLTRRNEALGLSSLAHDGDY